ncbi:MAG: Succinyl-CoA--L-malate CoA-transferase beta subunit [Alphaproteobacteria bacterium MarineAlpha2_Bin1]|nr:MAG: Succinyl-CoA--L-malate CoA-transferase beta subunit [Alphaproteobacteria bacterium MarineAlpha2_Bin1]
MERKQKPLDGIRVLEMGQLIAGPFAGCVLGYFGAEVIKLEPLGGDPLRRWRELDEEGSSFWWKSMARNKKSITVNLKSDEGKEIVRKLASKVDVIIENFRPGTMEKWQIGPEDLKKINPQLVYTRVSGYGQTGPYKDKPGFASVCEGIGGFRYLNGFPDQPPVRPNLSLGDTLAALNAVIGTLLALFSILKQGKMGKGQVVDVAIYEAVFNVMESLVPEFDGNGSIRERSGSTLTGIVPTNTYLCNDDSYVIIGGNGDSIFKRLMIAIGREDMAEDSRYSENAGRVEHEKVIDLAINKWTKNLSSSEVIKTLENAEVPCGPIYNVEDMLNDPHFQSRKLFETVDIKNKKLKIPAITPFLNETPGCTDWAGPDLGSHNHEIFSKILNFDEKMLIDFEKKGII